MACLLLLTGGEEIHGRMRLQDLPNVGNRVRPSCRRYVMVANAPSRTWCPLCLPSDFMDFGCLCTILVPFNTSSRLHSQYVLHQAECILIQSTTNERASFGTFSVIARQRDASLDSS